MWKKRAVCLVVLGYVGIMLSGCEEEELIYKEDLKAPISDIEESIEAELEMLNPDHDLEVTISPDSD